MKRHALVLLLGIALCRTALGQELAIATSHVLTDFPVVRTADSQIRNKLTGLLSNAGVGANSERAGFVLVPRVSILNEEVTAGVPSYTLLELNLDLQLVDMRNGKVLAAKTAEIKGKGNNRANATARALRSVKFTGPAWNGFINQAKARITKYYEKEGRTLLAHARLASARKQYEEAIRTLVRIPNTVSFFPEVDALLVECIEGYTDTKDRRLVQKAQSAWAASQNAEGAAKAIDLLGQISPGSKMQKDIDGLLKAIGGKISADDKRAWEMKLAEMNSKHQG